MPPNTNKHPLAAARRRVGLSQAATAALAGVSKPTVARIEAGARMLHCTETLLKIARALDVEVHSIVEPDQISDEAGFISTAVWLQMDPNDAQVRDFLTARKLEKEVSA